MATPMTPEQWAAYQAYFASISAPAATPPVVPIVPTATPTAPVQHEEVPTAQPKKWGPAGKAIVDVNAMHNKTHNLLKCKGCRDEFVEALRESGNEVTDSRGEIVIQALEEEE